MDEQATSIGFDNFGIIDSNSNTCKIPQKLATLVAEIEELAAEHFVSSNGTFDIDRIDEWNAIYPANEIVSYEADGDDWLSAMIKLENGTVVFQ